MGNASLNPSYGCCKNEIITKPTGNLEPELGTVNADEVGLEQPTKPAPLQARYNNGSF